MARISPSRKCFHCNKLFVPHPRNCHHQRFCKEPDCRIASKSCSQRKWLNKSPNTDYFRCPENSARVRAWRKKNPLYWKRPPSAKISEILLQEVLTPQPAPIQPLARDRFPLPLQDLLNSQLPMITGLISSLLDTPLQEDIAAHMRQLIAKGSEILGT